MIIFTFFQPILQAMNEGRVIRTSVAWVLRAQAVMVVLLGLVGSLTLLASGLAMKGLAILGGLVMALVVAAVALAVFQVLWSRARTVLDLGDSPFTVIPILGILCRATGEQAAVMLAGLGLAGCLGSWLTGGSLAADSFMPFEARHNALGPAIGMFGGGFLGGLGVLVLFAFLAFLSLVFFYFLAESLVVLVDIARNIRDVRLVAQRMGSGEPSEGRESTETTAGPVSLQPVQVPEPASRAHAEPPVIPVAPAWPRACRTCGYEVPEGFRFCEACGTAVG